MEKHSSLMAYITGLGTALFGGVTLQELAIWVGIITALGTFLVNWYYKAHEAARFEKLLHKKAVRAGVCDADEE